MKSSRQNKIEMKKPKDPKKLKSDKEDYAEEWELESGMGILPENIPFTQNIGCVGGKTKKPGKEADEKE